MICYAEGRKRKAMRVCRLFAEGCGGEIVVDARDPLPDEAFFYGVSPRQVPLWRRVIESGWAWYYADNAYAPPPLKQNGLPLELFRITRGARQITGTGPGDALRRDIYMPPIRPWRKSGREILVCVQSEHHYRLCDTDRERWIMGVTDALERATDRPVVIRDKPLRKPDEAPFEAALETAWAVVTYNSRVAIEAILAGVPAFVSVECAASPVAGHDLSMIEDPPRPDGREEWAAWLAANQWTVPEITSGIAWRQLQEK